MRDGFSTNLRDDFGIGVQLQETSSKFGRRGMIVRFREDVDGASESNLHVRRLQCAMREVCCEFKTSLDVIRVFLSNSAPFKLYGDTQQIFTPSSNRVSPLLEYVNGARQVVKTVITSLPSSSEETMTSNKAWRTERKVVCASVSLLLDTKR